MTVDAREAIHPDSPPRDVASLCIELRDDSIKRNRKRFRKQREELEFALSHLHYVTDRTGEKSQQSVQPHSVNLFHLLRHKWSQISSVPTYIECRPQQPGFDDPALAEDAKLALESVLHDPLRGYRKMRRRWVMGALAARSWVMCMDYDFDIEECVFRLKEPWMFHRAPGFSWIHDIACPWVAEDFVWPLAKVREQASWMNLDLVKPDVVGAETASQGSDAREWVTRDKEKTGQDHVTLSKFWFKNDNQTVERSEDFNQCPECGYRSTSEVSCPDCGAGMTPVTETYQDLAHPNGRLVIVALESRVVVYDGDWPCPMRSFPYMDLACYEHPVDEAGLSDTALHWDAVTILNLTKRFWWEQLRRSAGMWLFPAEGLLGAQRQPFQYSDLHGQLAYWTDLQKARGVDFKQGPTMPPGLPQFHELIASDFRAGSGISDFGLSPEQSKDIPVGTVRTLEQQGEIPVKDHLAIIQEEESIGFGVLLDIIVHTWGRDPQRAVRYLGPDGVLRVKRLEAATLTSMEVVVFASPTFGQLKAQEIDDYVKWASLFQMNPVLALFVAERQNLPPSLVQRMVQAGLHMPPPETPSKNGKPDNGVPAPVAQRMNGGLNG